MPKIDPLPGSVQIEWKRCGRQNCACSRGRLHGPYYSRRWREGGRQRRQYVRSGELAATLLAIEAQRATFPASARILAALRAGQDEDGIE